MKRSHKERLIVIVLLVVASSIAFSPVLHNGFINYDDPGYVTKNDMVKSGISLRTVTWAFATNAQSNWHPLTWLSHAMDCTLFGTNPVYHHLVNLILHILNAVFLFLVFEGMTGGLVESAFVAFVFALHPLHVESVAWISERKDVLSTLFWILSTGTYVKYARSGKQVWYAITILLFGLGLLAKPMLVTLPFVLILLDYWPLGRLRVPWGETREDPGKRRLTVLQSITEKIPLFILTGLSGVITYLVQTGAGSVAPSSLLPFTVRAGNAVISYVRYLTKIFVPVRLSVFYPHTGLADPFFEVAGAIVLLISLTILFWRLKSRYPYLLVGWLWFVGTLVPVIGFVQVGLQSMADRYMYLPMTGVIMMIAWGGSAIAGQRKSRRQIFAAGAVIVLLGMGAGTFVRAGYWKDSSTLFRNAIENTENNHLALNNLGAVLADSGKHTEALVHLEEALKILPDQPAIHINIARSLAALGRSEEAIREYRWLLGKTPDDPNLYARVGDLLAAEGRKTDAAAEYHEAIRLDSVNAFFRSKLAGLYFDIGDLEGAKDQCAASLRLQPNNPDAHRVMGLIELKNGMNDAALNEFSTAISSDSSGALSYNLMGLIYERRGEMDSAVAMYRLSVRYNPDDWNAQLNLGTALGRRNSLTESELHLRRAAELNPASADVHANLGKLYAIRGMNPEAIREFREALQLDSTQVHAFYNMGILLAKQGRLGEADSALTQAVRLAPSYTPAVAALKQVRSMRGK